MIRLAANLSFLFTEVDFLDRFAAAAEAGFNAVEWHFPYDHDQETLAARLEGNDLACVLFNLPPGDWQSGERGIACLPDRVADFEDGVGLALDYAEALGCRRINCLAGLAPPGVDEAKLRATLVANLRHAAGRFAEAGITLLIEPINSRDMPGFYLNRCEPALSIIEAVGADNLMLQYDVYHGAVMAGDPLSVLETHISRIGHIQIADHPGRHEPGTGGIDFPGLFDRLERLGYDGWVACEYNPATTTTEGLAWARPYLTTG